MADMSAAIKKAQEAAGEVIDAEAQYDVPATTAPQAGAVVPFQKPSMAALGNATGINNQVDMWLKVNEHGIQIGSEKPLITDGLKVKVAMVEDEGFFVKQSIKWGKPINYASTYDGIMSDKGGSWNDQVAMVQAIDPTAKMFPSADILLVLAEDLKLKDKTLPAGTKLGHTLSMSNFGNWSELYREAAAANQVGQEIDLQLDYEEINGKNGFTWGVLTFALS